MCKNTSQVLFSTPCQKKMFCFAFLEVDTLGKKLDQKKTKDPAPLSNKQTQKHLKCLPKQSPHFLPGQVPGSQRTPLLVRDEDFKSLRVYSEPSAPGSSESDQHEPLPPANHALGVHLNSLKTRRAGSAGGQARQPHGLSVFICVDSQGVVSDSVEKLWWPGDKRLGLRGEKKLL